MYRIHVQPLPGEAFDVIVDEGRVTIGRSRSCEVTLSSPYVSRQHAELALSAEGLQVIDLGSRNGVRLAEERVDGMRGFEEGEPIRIGCFHLSVERLPSMPMLSSDPSHVSGIL